MAPKLRKSKQRDRILTLLQSQRVHVTANWLYDQLRVDFPTLSLGNVYRNLNILVEQGLINRLGFGSTFDVYEAKREPHYHFVCDSCGTIEDVHTPKELQEEVGRWVEQQEGHVISSTTVEFHGICRRCRKKEEIAGNDDL